MNVGILFESCTVLAYHMVWNKSPSPRGSLEQGELWDTRFVLSNRTTLVNLACYTLPGIYSCLPKDFKGQHHDIRIEHSLNRGIQFK